MAHESAQRLRGDILGLSLLLLTHAVSDGPLLAALHLETMQHTNRDRRSVDFQPHHHGPNDVFRLQTRRSGDGSSR